MARRTIVEARVSGLPGRVLIDRCQDSPDHASVRVHHPAFEVIDQHARVGLALEINGKVEQVLRAIQEREAREARVARLKFLRD